MNSCDMRFRRNGVAILSEVSMATRLNLDARKPETFGFAYHFSAPKEIYRQDRHLLRRSFLILTKKYLVLELLSESRNSTVVLYEFARSQMGVLSQIQADVLDPKTNLGSILLKLRFLASRLDSAPLADWVKHEAEGYPDGDVPDYRIVGVSYSGNWSGPLGSGINDAPIPSHLIRKFAGEHWVRHKVRQSVASIEELVSGDGTIGIDAADLILMLQGKVYERLACNSVTGVIARAAMVEVLQNVRSRVLELTIELEKKIPGSKTVEIASPILGDIDKAHISQIINQTIYGGVTQINASDGSQVSLNVVKGDLISLERSLVSSGFAPDVAKDVAAVIASEPAEDRRRPLNENAKAWITRNAGNLAGVAGRLSVSALTKLLEEAALRYFGLK